MQVDIARLHETHETELDQHRATIQHLNAQLREKDQRLREKNEQLRQKETQLQQKDLELQQRSAEVSRLQGELQVCVFVYQERPDPGAPQTVGVPTKFNMHRNHGGTGGTWPPIL